MEEENKELNWNSKDYTELASLAMRLPDEIMAYEKKIIALNRGIDAINKRKSEIEHKYLLAVNQEKETYTNAQLREAEQAKRLREDATYQAFSEEQASKTMDIQESKAELDRLKNQFRGLEILADLMKIKYRVN